MHRNMINDKKYIGITSRNVDLRWQNGLGYKNTHFGNAIKKYGWENFSVETLYFGEDYNTKEKEYIKVSTGFGVRYTVPQYIQKGCEDVMLRFRVTDIFKCSSIVISSKGNVLKKIKRQVMSPGEMESVKLNFKADEDILVEVVNE